MGIRVAEAGKHVVVEKPIEVTRKSADRLIGACERAGAGLGVISQHRYDPGVVRLRQAARAIEAKAQTFMPVERGLPLVPVSRAIRSVPIIRMEDRTSAPHRAA